ncbi:MAG TPA: hypothetical protein VFZ09_06095 [Archangium sp.]|uniref:hypothetical protein n=1 Tax=Archangium sp. TaxID=1872627 RepID=UPI002E376602|nr:hypothetical protein [Archangium sp.]HEX5745793.1 hypothetical protein [Archangium sp.]
MFRRLIALTPKLQNNPGEGLVPEQWLAAQVALDTLASHLQSGFIQAESLDAPSNQPPPCVVLTVKGRNAGVGALGFMGGHFDVVPADEKDITPSCCRLPRPEAPQLRARAQRGARACARVRN